MRLSGEILYIRGEGCAKKVLSQALCGIPHLEGRIDVALLQGIPRTLYLHMIGSTKIHRPSSIKLNLCRRDVLAGMIGSQCLTWASASSAKVPRVIEMLGPGAPGERSVSLTSTGMSLSFLPRPEIPDGLLTLHIRV